jgi:hypothetical protein
MPETKRSWASVVSGKKDKPKPKPKPKPEPKPEEKKIGLFTQKELDELLQWAEENGYADDGGCDAHDRIGCAECRFNASGVCPSSKEEGHWRNGPWGREWVYD